MPWADINKSDFVLQRSIMILMLIPVVFKFESTMILTSCHINIVPLPMDWSCAVCWETATLIFVASWTCGNMGNAHWAFLIPHNSYKMPHKYPGLRAFDKCMWLFVLVRSRISSFSRVNRSCPIPHLHKKWWNLCASAMVNNWSLMKCINSIGIYNMISFRCTWKQTPDNKYFIEI